MSTLRRVSIAPMMAYTTRHYRYMMRLLSQYTQLYTEMITAGALYHGDYQRFLAHHEAEYPLVLQVGGSDPQLLAHSARRAYEHGYREINLNVGCPSERVQKGAIGACLMKEPELVAECMAAMRDAAPIVATVKTRIGVDEMESYEAFADFVSQVHERSATKTFIIHARKAWLKGLSPKENRDIPPLKYEWVYRLKQAFPHLDIIINGGITDWAQAQMHLKHVDGVMIGRMACHDPYAFATVDRDFYHVADAMVPTRDEIFNQYMAYVEICLANGVPLPPLAKPVLPLYLGCPNASVWRRYLSEHMHQKGAGIDVLWRAFDTMQKPG